jgi:hypothetical protein
VEVNPDGEDVRNALAKIGGKDVAGIGPQMMAEAAGGKVIVAPMEVGDQGMMAFIANPWARSSAYGS